jgi:hypothetical protein
VKAAVKIVRLSDAVITPAGKMRQDDRSARSGRNREMRGSNVGLGLAEALHAVADLPLAALLEQIDALEALQDVAFDDEAGGALEAFVL